MQVIQNKLTRSLTGRVMARRGWHQMLHRRASGARQREDERRSPVADHARKREKGELAHLSEATSYGRRQSTGRANAARGGALVTGPALCPALLIIPFLAVLSFLYINIYINTTLANSHAINDTDSYSFNLTDTTNLSISLPAPETLTLTPSAEGVFGSKSIAVGVSTNSPYGYTLTMSAASSSLSRSAAVGGVTPTIPALETAVSEADFPNNYWGFKRTSTAVADTNYQPMLANHSVLVNNTSANADSSSSTITFGVKLSNETPSGDYSINIDFLAVTNVAPNLYYMQDATPSSLAAAMPSVGDTTVLYDRRDNKEYTVAKLADGKYWMTKNLNLAGGTVLTSEDTDMASDWVLPTANGFQEGNKLPESSNTGAAFSDSSQAYIYNSSNNTDDCTNGCYSYYSWNAATLGSGADITTEDTDVPYSICPKGWQLPTSRSTLELAKTSSDFYQMAIHYGLNPANVNETSDAAPTFCTSAGDCPGAPSTPRFLRAGYYVGSTFGSGGTTGYYWSSTANGSTSARILYFYSGFVYSAASDGRRDGYSVRCLFDDTMQSFSSDYADSLAMEESVTLRDKRDNQEYTVAKLKDGKVWMTKNLNLAGGTTLTPADSDVAENYTLPASSSTGFDNDTVAYTYNSGTTDCTVGTGCYSYYNYIAATAGSAPTKSWTNAEHSVCPKGWRLPTMSNQDSATDVRQLLYAITGSTLTGFTASTSPTITQVRTKLLGDPLLFKASGACNNTDGCYSNTNSTYLITATTGSETIRSNIWYFDTAQLVTGAAYHRMNGYPVRCLLRTE